MPPTPPNQRTRSRPTQAFVDWLDKQLPSLQPGNRLPSVPKMCAQWKLSAGTVRSILREYQQKGRLVLIPGRGTFVPEEQQEVAFDTDHRASSTQTVVDFVAGSVQRGTLKLGEALPSVKYMALQFKVAPMTVVRAYRELQKRGMVARVGKTFWVGSGDTLARLPQRRHAVLFNATDDFTAVFRSGWLAPAYHRLERELRSYGFTIAYEPLAEFARMAQSWRSAGRAPDALVFHELAVDMLAGIRTALDTVDRRTGATRMLFDWPAGDYRQLPRGRSTFILSRGNIYTVRARSVAEFALRQGVGTVYLYFDEQQNSFNTFLAVARIRSELEALGGACRFAILARPLPGSATARQFFERLYTVRTPQHVSMVLSKYHVVSHTQLEEDTRVVRDVGHALTVGEGKRLYLFMNDTQAVEALRAAAQLRVKVPAEAGVLSFANDPQYLHEGISSCVPDWQQIGYLMAHALIGDFPIARTGKGFLRVRADVLERQTT